MTKMRRITVSFPECIAKQMDEMKSTPRFMRHSYSHMIRLLIIAGLNALREEKQK